MIFFISKYLSAIAVFCAAKFALIFQNDGISRMNGRIAFRTAKKPKKLLSQQVLRQDLDNTDQKTEYAPDDLQESEFFLCDLVEDIFQFF